MAAPPLRSAQARAGAIIVAMVIVAAVLAPLVLPWDPACQDLPHRLDGPTWQHWFGLDELGRDILARVLLGGRISLMVGIISTLVSLIIEIGRAHV